MFKAFSYVKGRMPMYMRQIPKVKDLCRISEYPHPDIIFMNASGLGKCSTEAGRYL